MPLENNNNNNYIEILDFSQITHTYIQIYIQMVTPYCSPWNK